MPTGKVFISYRRSDAGPWAGRLYDSLASRLGHERVWFDYEALGGGDPWEQLIDDALADTAVFLAVIGPQYATVAGDDGRPRLADPADVLRRELASALRHPRARVIPVLVGGASLPPASSLPEDIAGVRKLHSVPISDAKWRRDCDDLAADIAETIGPLGVRTQERPAGRSPWTVSAAVAAAALVAAYPAQQLAWEPLRVQLAEVGAPEAARFAAMYLACFAVLGAVLGAAAGAASGGVRAAVQRAAAGLLAGGAGGGIAGALNFLVREDGAHVDRAALLCMAVGLGAIGWAKACGGTATVGAALGIVGGLAGAWIGRGTDVFGPWPMMLVGALFLALAAPASAPAPVRHRHALPRIRAG